MLILDVTGVKKTCNNSEDLHNDFSAILCGKVVLLYTALANASVVVVVVVVVFPFYIALSNVLTQISMLRPLDFSWRYSPRDTRSLLMI